MHEREVDFRMRLNGAQYLALPESLRGAVVIGMIDMLELASMRFTPREKPRVEKILSYASSLKEVELRWILDDYLSNAKTSQQYAVASNLIVALAEKIRVGKI